MDALGKKASELEIITDSSLIENQKQLNSLNFELFYAILDEGHSFLITSPVDGFMNILFPESSNPCISPYFLREESFIIRGGENIIHTIKSGDTLEWKNTYGDNTAVVLFAPYNMLDDFTDKFEQEIGRFDNGLLTKSNNRIGLIITQVLDLYNRTHPLHSLRIQALLIEAFVHQVEGLYAENTQKNIILNKNHYDFVIRAKEIIDNDLSKNHTIPELAKEVGTNEQYLKKYFKQHHGKTVMSYITERKMEYAKELILTGNYRVIDVARMTGYKHSTHFTTAFKKYFGFIPNSLKYTFLVAQQGAQHVLSELDSFIGLF